MQSRSQGYADNVRQMRIVYTISALAVIVAIVLLVLAFLAGGQVNPTSVTTGFNQILPGYTTSTNPMQTGSLLFSPNRTYALVFTDNLYLIGFQVDGWAPILWSATNSPLDYSAVLTLSATGNLSIQQVGNEGQIETVWSSDKEGQTQDYNLQVTDLGQAQIVGANSEILWFIP